MAEALQGVWRVTSVSLKGDTVHSQQTHLVVADNHWREVWDRTLYSDEPRPETTFAVDGDFLDLATTWFQPDGSAHGPFEGRWAFALDGDTLRTCAAGYEEVPNAVDDTQGTVTTYTRVRDPGEIARVTAPVAVLDKPTRHHPRLGELRWDGNLEWFKSSDGLISLVLGIDDPLDAHADRALDLLAREAALKQFAAEALLDTYNESWRDEGPPATASSFVGHLVLEGITVHDDLGAEAYFEDGDLFAGHVVLVSIDADGTPTDATIAG
ncbi:MAG: DUF2262 domain-containing protein [Deltaproteobacteria bacterium]|nr:MAG: DUF2262 domain-containing protein [Deltaproteobacteria bacterium]